MNKYILLNPLIMTMINTQKTSNGTAIITCNMDANTKKNNQNEANSTHSTFYLGV